MKPREGARPVGDVGGIMIDELVVQPIEIGLRARQTAFAQAALQHALGAAADHVARRRIGDLRNPFAVEHEVERRDEIGCRVDERPVEIEHDGGPQHGPSLAVRRAGRNHIHRHGRA